MFHHFFAKKSPKPFSRRLLIFQYDKLTDRQNVEKADFWGFEVLQNHAFSDRYWAVGVSFESWERALFAALIGFKIGCDPDEKSLLRNGYFWGFGYLPRIFGYFQKVWREAQKVVQTSSKASKWFQTAKLGLDTWFQRLFCVSKNSLFFKVLAHHFCPVLASFRLQNPRATATSKN